MALSKQALQKKRQNKKSKRQNKIVKSPSSSPISYNHWPIHECWMPTSLWEAGIGQIIVSRKNSADDVIIGIYLIDVYCLGVKNCFTRLTDVNGYENFLTLIGESCGEIVQVAPSYANTLIHRAIDYAQQFGFKPHADFNKAQLILNNIPTDPSHEFVFGKDGKPLYIQGPNESLSDARKISKTLSLHAGAENSNFMILAD